MSGLITHLKNKQLVWQGSQHSASAGQKLATGVAQLDDALNGGFPANGVIRINSTMSIGELKLCMPVITQRQNDQRQLFIIAPTESVHAPMLVEHGIALERTFFVQSEESSEQLWACEQCLKSATCHTVLLWHNQLSLSQAKRLQVAAEQGDCLLIVFQYTLAAQPLPISLSMQMTRHEQQLRVDITKQRGGWPVTDLVIHHTLSSIHQRHQVNPHTTLNNVIPLRAQR